jgi:pantoate--beta-alanine ligase
MITLDRIDDVRAACACARRDGGSVGLVPTMGFFHDGHRTLMRTARANHDFVVVSIFVNPLQFGAAEDLDSYPSDPAGDAAVAEAEDIDVLFAPSVAEMYPEPPRTTVHVSGLTDGLCGDARPTHFDGVTTVVAKLFSIVGPCSAYFGRKDAQQLAVVRRMAADLDLPVDVVGCALVREPDGLAMSSRNAYLSPAEREAATVLSRSLYLVSEALHHGVRDTDTVTKIIADTVSAEPRCELEYAEVRRASDLEPIDRVDGEVLIAVAAHVGGKRLIDNISVHVDDDRVEVDLGVQSGKSTREAAKARA